LIQKRLAPKVLVTHLDVERFYEENPDSIPKQPATVRLAHILILLLPSEGAEKRAQEELEEIVAAIDAGVGWDYLAEKHSDDRGTKYGGGDLGYFKRGEMVPEFEEAAFSLKVGEITAVRSRLGYHLVKCEAKRNEEVRARHILLKVVPSRSDTLRARSIAEEAKKRAISGEDFSALVSEYSQDQASREKKGELGAFAVEDLPSPLDEAVRGVEPGGIGGPILSEFGYHVVKVLDKKEARTPTFEEIKDRLKTYLTQRQMEEEYRKWIERLREEVYIESRL